MREYTNQYLKYYGYRSLQEFQSFIGIEPTSKLDDNTVKYLQHPRCGCPDFLPMLAEERLRKWGKNQLTYKVYSFVHGLNVDDQYDIFGQAWKSWVNHTNLSLEPSNLDSADIIISTGQGNRDGFDGPGGILAWAYLPGDSTTDQLVMKFDFDENWSLQANAGILLLNVAAHEFGHLLGLEHLRDKKTLMYPYYNPDINEPKSSDIVELVKRYGEKTEPKEDELHIIVKGHGISYEIK